jgi:hypothetical protein
MTMPGPGGGPMPYVYIPLPVAVKELRLNDMWLARWSEANELPKGAPVNYVYTLLYMGDKGYVVREKGTENWRSIEGVVEDESAEAWIEREIPARTGLTVGKTALVGFLACRPTKFNTEFPAGSFAVRPLYIVVASKVGETPDDSAYERRRLPMNEYLVVVRNRYPEIREHIDEAAGRYVRMRAKGEA